MALALKINLAHGQLQIKHTGTLTSYKNVVMILLHTIVSTLSNQYC